MHKSLFKEGSYTLIVNKLTKLIQNLQMYSKQICGPHHYKQLQTIQKLTKHKSIYLLPGFVSQGLGTTVNSQI